MNPIIRKAIFTAFYGFEIRHQSRWAMVLIEDQVQHIPK